MRYTQVMNVPLGHPSQVARQQHAIQEVANSSKHNDFKYSS